MGERTDAVMVTLDDAFDRLAATNGGARAACAAQKVYDHLVEHDPHAAAEFVEMVENELAGVEARAVIARIRYASRART